MKHIISFDFMMSKDNGQFARESRDQMYEWCIRNIAPDPFGTSWDYSYTNESPGKHLKIHWRFTNEKDAVLFALKFK